MRIAIVNQHPSEHLGGSELQCDVIARTLAEHGHKVKYFAVGGARSNHHMAYKIRSIKADLSDVLCALEEDKTEVVYWRHNKRHLLKTVLQTRSVGAAFVFGCAAESDVTWFATTIRKDAPIRFRRIKQLYQMGLSAFNHIGLALVDGIVAQNQAQLQALPFQPKVQIYNSYVDQMEPFSWPKRYVAWVGTVKWGKRPQMFVDLARRCKDLDIDFIMVGETAIPGFFAGETPRNLHYLGPKTYPEANGIIRGSDFVVHTSASEGFSNVLVQAWMNSKATLTVGVDPDNLIEDHGAGKCCRNFEELVSTTRTLTTSTEQIEILGKRSFAMASPRFDADRNVRTLVQFIRRALP